MLLKLIVKRLSLGAAVGSADKVIVNAEGYDRVPVWAMLRTAPGTDSDHELLLPPTRVDAQYFLRFVSIWTAMRVMHPDTCELKAVIDKNQEDRFTDLMWLAKSDTNRWLPWDPVKLTSVELLVEDPAAGWELLSRYKWDSVVNATCTEVVRTGCIAYPDKMFHAMSEVLFARWLSAAQWMIAQMPTGHSTLNTMDRAKARLRVTEAQTVTVGYTDYLFGPSSEDPFMTLERALAYDHAGIGAIEARSLEFGETASRPNMDSLFALGAFRT